MADDKSDDKSKGDDKGKGGGDDKGSPDLAKRLESLEAQNKDLMSKLEKLSAKPGGDDDEDLSDKARKQRAADDKKSGDTKALEAALKFSMRSDEFLKTNQSLLPKDISDIFKAAEKEKFSDAIEKDGAIKSGIIQSFFAVQANIDLLTPGLKTNLEDYLKLTKTGKQEKAREIYDTIFEPAFEMLRRIKKAEALNKGFGNESDSDEAYKQKLIAGSKKHYLGEKPNA